MSDDATMEKIGELRGELNGLTDRVGAVETVARDGRDAALRTEAILKTMVGSGPHQVMRAPQSATEPKTDSVVSKAMSLAGKPIAIHGLYIGAGLVALLIFAIWHSGRPAADFLPGLREQSRSGIGPLDQRERHP